MKKIRMFITSVITGLFVLAPVAAPAMVSAQSSAFDSSKTAVCQGIEGAGSDTCTGTSGKTIDRIIKTSLEILSFIIGVVAVIMIMIGGFKYITAAGDASNIASAKNTILYAIVGLVIAATAQVIVRFVIGRTT